MISFPSNRRKAISQAAIEKWPGNDIPMFKKNANARKELEDLVESLATECTFEPAEFNANSIRQHILDVLNERRRKHRNGHDYTQVNGCLVHSISAQLQQS